MLDTLLDHFVLVLFALDPAVLHYGEYGHVSHEQATRCKHIGYLDSRMLFLICSGLSHEHCHGDIFLTLLESHCHSVLSYKVLADRKLVGVDIKLFRLVTV